MVQYAIVLFVQSISVESIEQWGRSLHGVYVLVLGVHL